METLSRTWPRSSAALPSSRCAGRTDRKNGARAEDVELALSQWDAKLRPFISNMQLHGLKMRQFFTPQGRRRAACARDVGGSTAPRTPRAPPDARHRRG